MGRRRSLAMTEADWLACRDSKVMLEELDIVQEGLLGGDYHRKGARARKWRLLACAICRRVYSLLDESSRQVIDTVERFAEGDASLEELATARRIAEQASQIASAGSHLDFLKQLVALPHPEWG